MRTDSIEQINLVSYCDSDLYTAMRAACEEAQGLQWELLTAQVEYDVTDGTYIAILMNWTGLDDGTYLIEDEDPDRVAEDLNNPDGIADIFLGNPEFGVNLEAGEVGLNLETDSVELKCGNCKVICHEGTYYAMSLHESEHTRFVDVVNFREMTDEIFADLDRACDGHYSSFFGPLYAYLEYGTLPPHNPKLSLATIFIDPSCCGDFVDEAALNAYVDHVEKRIEAALLDLPMEDCAKYTVDVCVGCKKNEVDGEPAAIAAIHQALEDAWEDWTSGLVNYLPGPGNQKAGTA